MFFRFLKKTWRVFFVPEVDDKGSLGETDNEARTILVMDCLRGRPRLVILLHELLHAGNWRKSEKEVEELSIAMGNLLWDVGYRLPDDRIGPRAP